MLVLMESDIYFLKKKWYSGYVIYEKSPCHSVTEKLLESRLLTSSCSDVSKIHTVLSVQSLCISHFKIRKTHFGFYAIPIMNWFGFKNRKLKITVTQKHVSFSLI